ncbi:MAG: polysaccharide biosynthesis tyrosine autokinase [Prevotellaceae bacterium]|jgi:capsular exopolysaccharide synthesis family protein|nr:polysaccharide biosynthesis tyrosine autokinase [Prevotellaceae bacterium]
MVKERSHDFDFVEGRESRSDDSIVVADLLDSLMRYRAWFMLSVTVCVLLGMLYLYRSPQRYKRTATILVKDDKKSNSMGEAAAFQDILKFGTGTVENDIGFFRSKRLMRMVSDRLRLDVSYKVRNGLCRNELFTTTPYIVDFPDALPRETFSFTLTPQADGTVLLEELAAGGRIFWEILTATPGELLDTPLGQMKVTQTAYMTPAYVGIPIYVTKGDRKAISDGYNQRLSVEIAHKQSALVNLTLEDENALRAQAVIDTLIGVYNEDAIQDKNTIVNATANFINERLCVIEKELDEVDGKVENYKRIHHLTDIASQSDIVLQYAGKLEAEKLSVVNQLNMAQYLERYLRDADKTEEPLPAGIGISDAGIQSQISAYNAELIKRNKYITHSSPGNPLVQDMNATLQSMRISLQNAMKNLITDLEIQQRNMLLKEQEYEQKIQNVPALQMEVVSIEREQKIKEELYLYLLEKKEENALQLIITQSNCRIVDPADGSEQPVSPRKLVIIAASLMLGLFLPAGFLYVRSLFNTRVHTRKEVKDALNIPFLGEIPQKSRSYAKDLVVQSGGGECINEAFRLLRDNMDFMSADESGGAKVVLLTSFNPNSGKTFIAGNLAMSMALAGARVLLIDIDLRKGSATRKWGAGIAQPGLSTYLSGQQSEVQELIVPWENDHARVDLLPTGPLPPNPAELLRSNRLDVLLSALRQSYDYIVIDNPAYGMVTDTSLCLRLAGQVLFVMRAGLFDKRLLPDVQELYDSGKLTRMGLVLNGVKLENNRYGYGYGYGYGYKYAYGAEKNAGRPRLWRRLLGV